MSDDTIRVVDVIVPNRVQVVDIAEAVGPPGEEGPEGPQGEIGPEGPEGPQGPQGTGLTILGSIEDSSELPPTGDPGDAYIASDGDLWVWTGAEWENVGPARGPAGPQGEQGEQGEQGPQGEQGEQGETGPTGLSGAASETYVHTQAVPDTVWTIEHGLGYAPNVTVVDSSGSQVEGDVVYSESDIVITFSAAFGGVAYLS